MAALLQKEKVFLIGLRGKNATKLVKILGSFHEFIIARGMKYVQPKI